MSAEQLHEPIILPRFEAARFAVMGADVQVIMQDEIEQAELHLQGREGAFDHFFKNGALQLTENGDAGAFDVTRRGISIFSGMRSRGSISISGVSVNGDKVMGSPAEPRSVKLLLPPGLIAEHQIRTQSGDVRFEGVRAEELRAKTMSGDVWVEHSSSAQSATIKTMSGDISVVLSEAPHWDLETMSGDITARSISNVEPRTMSGRIRVG